MMVLVAINCPHGLAALGRQVKKGMRGRERFRGQNQVKNLGPNFFRPEQPEIPYDGPPVNVYNYIIIYSFVVNHIMTMV